jgi:hypothetical protein
MLLHISRGGAGLCTPMSGACLHISRSRCAYIFLGVGHAHTLLQVGHVYIKKWGMLYIFLEVEHVSTYF